MEKAHEIQLTKNKMVLNNRIRKKNHPPSPVLGFNTLCIYMLQIWYENRYKSSSREERRHGTTLLIKTRHKSSSSGVETRKQQTNLVGSAA